MDIHLNVWGIKTRLDGENVWMKLREVESKTQVIGHMSLATAKTLHEDLGKLLKEQPGGASKSTEPEQGE